MRIKSTSHYFVYITTNETKNLLSIGITGDLSLCLYDHDNAYRELDDRFAKSNYCKDLLWWEHFTDAKQAIRRELELKRLPDSMKNVLVEQMNPSRRVLNREFVEQAKLFL